MDYQNSTLNKLDFAVRAQAKRLRTEARVIRELARIGGFELGLCVIEFGLRWLEVITDA